MKERKSREGLFPQPRPVTARARYSYNSALNALAVINGAGARAECAKSTGALVHGELGQKPPEREGERERERGRYLLVRLLFALHDGFSPSSTLRVACAALMREKGRYRGRAEINYRAAAPRWMQSDRRSLLCAFFLLRPRVCVFRAFSFFVQSAVGFEHCLMKERACVYCSLRIIFK